MIRLALCGFGLVGLLVWGLHSWASLPLVYESWSSGECERVVLADGSAGDCAALPEKYERVWVK